MDGEPGAGAPFPFEIFLRSTGGGLRGMVSSCPRTPSEITDGRINGNTVTFTCSRDDRFGSIVLTGLVATDEITFKWHLPEGGTREGLENNHLFGERGPSSFTLRRVPDGELAKSVDERFRRVRGEEYSASVNLPKQDLRVIGTAFIPDAVNHVRATIAILRWGSGTGFFGDPHVRQLAQRTHAALVMIDTATLTTPVNYSPRHDAADALLMLLGRLAAESGHTELKDAPLVLWGHSAATAFPSMFAGKHPDRTIAFIRYHAGSLAVLGADVQKVKDIPGLILVAGMASAEAVWRAREYWKSGRLVDAPWTLSVDDEGDHGSVVSLQRANSRMLPWIEAVMRQRLSTAGNKLRPIPDASWLANFASGEIAERSKYRGTRSEANWFPDQQTATTWRLVIKTY